MCLGRECGHGGWGGSPYNTSTAVFEVNLFLCFRCPCGGASAAITQLASLPLTHFSARENGTKNWVWKVQLLCLLSHLPCILWHPILYISQGQVLLYLWLRGYIGLIWGKTFLSKITALIWWGCGWCNYKGNKRKKPTWWCHLENWEEAGLQLVSSLRMKSFAIRVVILLMTSHKHAAAGAVRMDTIISGGSHQSLPHFLLVTSIEKESHLA